MRPSRDLAYIVLFSVLSIINFASVLRIFALLTGIPEIVYGVDIISATLATVGFLIFQGRRWRGEKAPEQATKVSEIAEMFRRSKKK